MIARHSRILASDDCRSFMESPPFSVPDAQAIHRVGSVGQVDFLRTGFLLAELVRELVPDIADARVLDIGCGWGRLASALTPRLGAHARYHGIDVSLTAIEWCNREIAARDHRFSFQHLDAQSSYANPAGRLKAEELTLSDATEQYDVVVATSLFTHLMPNATSHYLREISRLCRPGGSLVATFFLLDATARDLCAAGRSHHRFPHKHGPAWLANLAVPEDAVAYEASFVFDELRAAGFATRVYFGAWSGRSNGYDFQDVVFAKRRSVA